MKFPKISPDRKWDIVILILAVLLSSLIVPWISDVWKGWRGHDVTIYYDPPQGGVKFMDSNSTDTFEIVILSEEAKPVSVKFSIYTDPSDKLDTEIPLDASGIISMGPNSEPKNVEIKLTAKNNKADVNVCFKLKDIKSKRWLVDQGDKCILVKIQ